MNFDHLLILHIESLHSEKKKCKFEKSSNLPWIVDKLTTSNTLCIAQKDIISQSPNPSTCSAMKGAAKRGWEGCSKNSSGETDDEESKTE